MPRNRNLPRLIFASVLLWLLALGSAPAMATGTYYVSPSGSDSNTGGINDPFLTIPAAQTALRAAGGGTVYLRGGTYTLTSTVVFTNQDSNSTYEAYPGEVPIISGGVVLSNWTLYSGDIYQASVNWNFRGLFKDGARLNYINPSAYTRTQAWSINVQFNDSWGPSSWGSMWNGTTFPGPVNAGDWVLDNTNHIVYYKTGGGAPTGTIVAGSLQTLFYVAGTATANVTNLTFDHLYFYYNNWVTPGGTNATYVDNWVGNYQDPFDGTKAGQIPGAVDVEFANNFTFRSCRIAHNASTGITFGRGVINSTVVGSEINDNGGLGIFFGYKGDSTADGFFNYLDPNGQTLTYVWNGNANWIEDSDTATDNYVYNNGLTYWTAANIRVTDSSNAQVSYNRTDSSQYSSIVGDDLFNSFKADYNHISNTNLDYPQIPDGGGIYSLSGQLSPNVGITAEYIGNLVHDTWGFGPLYTDESNDQYTVDYNVTYNVTGAKGNPNWNNLNNVTYGSNNNTTPTQAQINAAAASTGPRAPYFADLFGGDTDTTVTFADRPATNLALTGSYDGIDWGSQLWTTDVYAGVHEAWINSSSTSAVTQTFTLPAGKVLKSLSIHGGGSTVLIQSSGNADQTYTTTGSWTVYNTGWTTASATVTVTVTDSSGAWSTEFTNIVYGNPPSASDTTVTFSDRPATNLALTGIYDGIDWGSQLWTTDVYAGVHEAWFDSSSTSAVTQTFTLPAGMVLKGLSIHGGGSTVVVQSSGNPDLTYTTTGAWTVYNTGWTTASATVTITVTDSGGAWSTEFTNIVYGSP